MKTDERYNIDLSYSQEFDPESDYGTDSGLVRIKMGIELETRINLLKSPKKDVIQRNADLRSSFTEEMNVEGALFGTAKQNHGRGVELDKLYEADMYFHIETDNLLPYITPYTKLGIKFCHDFASGEICVFRYRDTTYCNQIKIENGIMVAHSFNPKYRPIILNSNEYHFIGVVDHGHFFISDFLKGL